MTIDEAIEFERYLSKQPEICNEDFMKCEEHKQIAEWLEELKQYRAIGTVEEFKDLKEKNEPKKAKYDNEDGWETYICTSCGKVVGEHQNYCWNCGQAFET